MKTVDFTTFKTKTNGRVKHFFEEGLIYNDMEMLSIVDARKHFEQRWNDDPFFETDPKDIEYVMDLYQKFELFNIKKVNFQDIHDSLSNNSFGENQPVWVLFDGSIIEIKGTDFELPENHEQGINPCVAVFKSFAFDEDNKDFTGWEHHIIESIESKMIEIEFEHFNGV